MFYLAFCIVSAFSNAMINPLSDIQIVYSAFNDSVYVFSGRKSPQEYSSSMKIFNYYDESYEILYNSFSSALIYPDDRSMYGMVIDPAGLVVYIYGGMGPKGVYGDLWMYFVNNDTFQQIILTGSHVPNRYKRGNILFNFFITKPSFNQKLVVRV